MNRSDLERIVAIGPERHLLSAPDGGEQGLGGAAHCAMLDALRQQHGRRGRAKAGGADVDQAPLVTALNDIAMRLLIDASQSLHLLFDFEYALAGVAVDYEGFRHAWRTRIKDIPEFANQLAWLRLAQALFALPIKRQHEAVALIRVVKELELARIHLDFAREDQLPDKVVALQMEVASMSSRLSTLRLNMPRTTEAWLSRSQSVVTALGWEMNVSAPLADPQGAAEQLIRIADSYEELGLRMQLPSNAGSPRAQRWPAATVSAARLYQDCGRGLRVIGWWLRALGSADMY